MSDENVDKFFRSVCVYYKMYQNWINFDEDSERSSKKE